MNVKQLKDALQDFVKGEREDLIEKTKKEINLIAEYLPTPMEREEIRKHIVSLAADIGAQTMVDMGKLMGAAMKGCWCRGKWRRCSRGSRGVSLKREYVTKSGKK